MTAPQEQQNPLLEFMDRYGPPAGEEGPVLFAEEVFGADLDPWQERVLRAYGRGERRISIRACHGPGKTFIAAVIVWHMLTCKFPQKTVATAPSRGQLEDALVAEIISLYGKLPEPLQELFEVKSNRIELRMAPKDSFFSARTSREEKPEALAGVHSDHVLLIADEASGVPEKIFESAAGSMSSEHATTLLLGNPVRSSGFFYDTHHKLADMWFTVHVSAFDSSRVTDDFITDIARRYGENSNAYRIRVLGEFPLADDDTVIPLGLIVAARQRDIVSPKRAKRIWGIDVARFGNDKNALCERTHREITELEEWGGVDLMATANRVKAKWDDTPVDLRPEVILIDSIGLGGGVVDRLRELGLPVRGVNVSESSALKDKYLNLRAELWFAMRDWLDGKDVKLPRCPDGCHRDCIHETLERELATPKYHYTTAGKIQVESKKDMKARGIESPNVAEAAILTFASEQSILSSSTRELRGWGAGVSWNEPLTRNLPRV